MAVVIAGVLAGILLLVLGAGAVVLLTRGGSEAGSAASSRATVTQSVTPSTTRAHRQHRHPSAAEPTTLAGDVNSLPAGLFCRDLNAQGYSYSAAVEYWKVHGYTNQMDADRNGIPCETVYSPSDVSAYWGERKPPGTFATGSTVDDLPAGLFCRDLRARGFSYSEAVDYYWLWGSPDRMDADLNGIPCETVYPPSDVNAFWYQ